MDHQVSVPEELYYVINCLENLHHMKGVLNYAELVSVIETSISFDVTKIFECIIYDPTRGSYVLKKLKDILVYLRDNKNEELKAMFVKKSSIPAPIIFYLLETTLQIQRIIKEFRNTYEQMYTTDPICDAYIYPYLCSLSDVVEVILYRHLKLFIYTYKYTADMDNYLSYIHVNILSHFSINGCETQNFSGTLQEKLGVNLEVSHLLKPDSECSICGDSLDVNSDFAVLDTCNHLMCADCAEVTLMGEVFDLIPLQGGADDENSDDHGHIVELGKIPKCPCCRREVGQWTTTHVMKFCQKDRCNFWHIYFEPQEPISIFDIFQNCIEECFQIRNSIPFVWMTICKHLRKLAADFVFRQNEFVYVVAVIEKVLKLSQAEKVGMENYIDMCINSNMSAIVNILNHLISNKKVENSTSIQQILVYIYYIRSIGQ